MRGVLQPLNTRSNSTFECQRLMNNKNENFKTLTTNESKGKVKKVKETCNIRGKLLEKG